MYQRQRHIKRPQNWERNAVIPAQHNRERVLSANLPHHLCNLVIRLRRNRRHHRHIAYVGPVLSFKHCAIAVNVVKTFRQLVVVFLRALPHSARTIPLARPAPCAFIKWHAEHREIRLQLIQVRHIRRAHERAHTHKCRRRLPQCNEVRSAPARHHDRASCKCNAHPASLHPIHCGHTAPPSIHILSCAGVSDRVSGGKVRPSPGLQPQPTRSSSATCSKICCRDRPPFCFGSFNCLHNSAGVRPTNTILCSGGGSAHFGFPGGMCSPARFAV